MEQEIEIRLPYAQGNLNDILHRNAQILEEQYQEEGIYLRLRVTERYQKMVQSYQI